jgi:hypothetical protein
MTRGEHKMLDSVAALGPVPLVRNEAMNYSR